jgi:hypothetical protein
MYKRVGLSVMDFRDREMENMKKIKKMLDRVEERSWSAEYMQICKLVNSYIFSKCEHEFETDLFDIDPDKSVVVKYCTKCFYCG